MIVRAIRETAAAAEIADRVEGRSSMKVEHGLLAGTEIHIKVNYED
jgi:hypothetical protein